MDMNSLFNELRSGIAEIAKNEGKQFAKQIIEDGESYLKAAEEDIKQWCKDCAKGKLKKDELEFLVRGKKDLAEMKALTQAGIAAARVDRVKTAIVDLTIDTLTKAL